MKNVRATSSDRPRQAYLGASRIRAAGTRISFALRDGAVAISWISVVRPRATPTGSAARSTTWPSSITSE